VLALAIAGSFVYLEDRAPNDGPSDEVYRLKVPAANSIVRLVAPVGDPAPATFFCSGVCVAGSAASQETPGASVTPGSTAGIPITVHNQATSKRLVNLTVRMDEPDPAWRFQLAPAIEVPAGKSRTVTLLVNASQTVAHKDSVRVVVEGRSLGHPEEMGRAELLIAAAVTPSPQQTTLYLHASEWTPEGAVVEGCYSLLACFNQYAFWMNTLEDDEEANIDDVGYEDYRLHSLGPLTGDDEEIVFEQYFVLDTPIARSIFMDTSEPATMSVRFSAPRAMDGTIRASIGVTDQARCDYFACGNYVPLADGSTSATIDADDTFTFLLPINPDFARIAPDDGRLAVLIQLSASDPLATSNQADGIRFHPAGSQVTLPVAVDPEADDDGPSLIGLYRGSDPEEFLNPGKARAFHVVATNEGVDADRIGLTAEVDQEGWTATFKPGDRYELSAGASVNVTMLVTAPATAKEGDRTTIVVRATSLNQTDSSSRVSFVAIATTGVQIEDESTTYDVDEDAAERVYQEPEGASPGLPLVALVAGLGVAVALRRRL
jgi:hypothetical protein